MTFVLGVIGGSGLYQMQGLTALEELKVSTPYGAPSDAIVRGKLDETTLLFLPRHGRNHRISPTNINYRANIHALKQLGATHVISVSAGVRGTQIILAPGDYARAVRATAGAIARAKE